MAPQGTCLAKNACFVGETGIKQRELSKETTDFTCKPIMSRMMDEVEVAPALSLK